MGVCECPGKKPPGDISLDAMKDNEPLKEKNTNSG